MTVPVGCPIGGHATGKSSESSAIVQVSVVPGQPPGAYGIFQTGAPGPIALALDWAIRTPPNFAYRDRVDEEPVIIRLTHDQTFVLSDRSRSHDAVRQAGCHRSRPCGLVRIYAPALRGKKG